MELSLGGPRTTPQPLTYGKKLILLNVLVFESVSSGMILFVVI